MGQQKIHILHLLSWAPTPENPTLGNFCFRHINSLPENCESVVLMTEVGNGVRVEPSMHYTLVVVGVKNSSCKLLRKWREWRAYQQGLSYVKKHLFLPDIVHLHVAMPLGRVALFWKKRFDLPYVVTEHWTGYQPQNRHSLSMRKLWLTRWIAREAKRVLPVSRDLQHCMQDCGISANYEVIYNVVDTSVFTPKTLNHSEKMKILHISTLRDDAKNFSGILRVVKQLSQQRTDFELNVIHDYAAPHFENYVRQHNLNGFVHFLGQHPMSEVANSYRQSDFLLLFSNFENLPCVIVEAFASGLPVVSSDVGGIAEIVNPERRILVPAGDEVALLNAMNNMLDHVRDYSAEKIRAYAEQQFSPQVIGSQIQTVYSQSIAVTDIKI